MKLLDTRFLVDYLRGEEAALRYLEDHKHESFAASPITGFELAFGIADASGDPTRLYDSLDWLDFVQLTLEDGIEAARLSVKHRKDGAELPVSDVLIAGMARSRGATLVANDGHFDDVEDLSVENYLT